MSLKRAFDLALALPAAALSLPVQAAVALAVRSRLGSPVLFRQERPGLHGRPFTMVKFRTMLDPDPERGLVTDADRLTSFGARLRSTSLDELPALWNVVTGDMSLVGPRPLLMRYLPRYTPHQARRHEVRPGLTGLAQVSGRNALAWEDRFDLDVTYVDTHSLALDLRILARTLGSVLRREGIQAEGSVTAEEFRGTPHAAPSAPAPGPSRPRVIYGVTVAATARAFLSGQLRAVQAAGAQVSLVCGEPELDDLASSEGVSVHHVPTARQPSPRSDLRSLVDLVRLLRRERPDTVVMGTPKMGLLGTAAAVLAGVPRRVYLLHGLRVEGAHGIARAVLWSMERAAFACSTEVVAVSPSLRERAVSLRLSRSASDILVLGNGSANGIDLTRFTPASTPNRLAARSRFGLPPEAMVIGQVGRVCADKGLSLLAETMERLSAPGDPWLLLVGGSEVASAEERRDLERLRRHPRVVEVDHIEDVEEAYAAIDLLVLLTRREGLPTVVLEAAASGVPALATIATGTVDAVCHNETGMLVPWDSAAVTTAVRDLVSDPTRLGHLGDVARRRVARDFERVSVWEGWVRFLLRDAGPPRSAEVVEASCA